MKIKKYIASSFNEGKKKILTELGGEAVILSTRNTTDKESGKEVVEIVAGIDEKQEAEQKAKKRPVKDKLSGLEAIIRSAQQTAGINPPGENRVNNYSPSSKKKTENNDIYDEIYEIKSRLSDIYDSIKYKYTPSLNEVFSSIYKLLIENEFSEELALKLTGELSIKEPQINFTNALDKLRLLISENIPINPPLQKSDKRQIISFIGPTGSGKTLALVKLSIIMNILGSKVMLVSADTYKVGGAEQLQTYASIAGVPFKAVYSLKEIKTVLTENTDFDFIFIDNKGVGHRDIKNLNLVSDYLKISKPDRTCLAMPSNISQNSFEDILSKYIKLNPTDIILTKLDESHSIGGLISAVNKYSIPVTYLTYGQNVPDDISPADIKKLGRLALPNGDVGYSIQELFDE
jgi:flagellar biosynthesis protein FlhF